ncbi:hypothetical protein [Streptomyces sp. NBC_01212]|uniref:hypothetical protein n=1 Tax=Streptomyces sp. NBC_01212 TaxID=2903775 RepID=UPI002E113923|nr:hypothetical protein OG722_04970 [Streptomyces sp. NBC_01212]
MKQRIEFTAFVDVRDDEPLTMESARGWVRAALLYGDRHDVGFTNTLDDVTFFSTVGDDE